nr:MAG TPA: hypothetical protein [Caudoviricetes sp.]
MSYANVMLYSSVIPSYDYDKKDKKEEPKKGTQTNFAGFLSKLKSFQ